MLTEIKQWYSALKFKADTERKKRLRNEAEERAERDFRVVIRDGIPYIAHDGAIITTTDDIDQIIDRLQILRERFVKDNI